MPKQDYTIYTKPNCPQCVVAKNILKSNNIPYLEIEIDVGQPLDLTKDYVSVAAFKTANPEVKTMPQIFIGDTRIGGVNELKYVLSI